MSDKSKLKEIFEPELKFGVFFAGGLVSWSHDGTEIFCQNTDSIKILDVTTGTVTHTFGGSDESNDETDLIHTFTTSPDGESIVTAHKSGLMKLWSKSENRLTKIWKGIHKGPVTRLVLNKYKKLASGGSDGSIRLWNLTHQTCTHHLQGSQGVVSVLEFHPRKEIVCGAADDTTIRCWNSETGILISTLKGHYSKITSIAFHDDDVHIISSSRDKVVILWDINEGIAKRTVPIFESIESISFLPSKFKIPGYKSKSKSEDFHVVCAGESGKIKIWNLSVPKEIFSQTNSLIDKAKEDGGLAITQLIFNKTLNQILVVSVDHNIIVHDLESFDCLKQFVGFSDEILDVVFLGENDSLLAVATNSQDIKLYHVATMSCQLLKGHTDLVLALTRCDSNRNLLASSGKDNSVRLWMYNVTSMQMDCIAVGARHTDSVGSIALSHLSNNFLVSVSQDSCLKLWEIPEKLDGKVTLNCTYTEIAHQRDINCVAISPNDKLIATGSQDKTAKLWSTDKLQQVGVFRGHRRGIWNVRFSPVDQVLLTTSADCTIKLWSITELNCLKTFEGHDASVLRGEFLSRGMQIISSGADGLLKLWNIKTSECQLTLDQHEARVWALAVSQNENYIVTGGSDSLLIKWKDVTKEKQEEAQKKKEEQVLQEQELFNLLQNNELLKALKLALRLERPFQVLKIIEKINKIDNNDLRKTILSLSQTNKEQLLTAVAAWNTNSKHCQSAQFVLNVLLENLLSGEFKPSGLGATVEGLLPYTDRHFKRITQQVRDLQYITYLIKCIQPVTETS